MTEQRVDQGLIAQIVDLFRQVPVTTAITVITVVATVLGPLLLVVLDQGDDQAVPVSTTTTSPGVTTTTRPGVTTTTAFRVFDIDGDNERLARLARSLLVATA